MARVIVLGAGMVGTASALALQAQGHEVALIDRKAPGRETSYGNAGIIQGEAVEPYALPVSPAKLLSLAMGADNAVRLTPAGVLGQLGGLLGYLANSLPARHRKIAASYAQLVKAATADHDVLIEASGAGNLITKQGFRQGYMDAGAFAAMEPEITRLARDYGVNAELMDGDALATAEPALKKRFAGAVHWHDAWSCASPGDLVGAYAQLLVSRGGQLLTGDAMSLKQVGSGWQVMSDGGPVSAEKVVVALGPWAPQLMKRFGYRIPMVRKRGYHLHFSGTHRLNLPLMHTGASTVFSPMKDGLRVATGAELAPMSAPVNRSQLIKAEAAARALLDIGPAVEAAPWFGNRPCMPDMMPVMGEMPRHPGLWAHFGHGHQGFTLGPTTARLMADAMAGDSGPLVQALSPLRYTGK